MSPLSLRALLAPLTLLLLLWPPCISAAAAATAAAQLSLNFNPTQLLAHPQTLPPSSTYAHLRNGNFSTVAPLRRSGRFVFAAIPAGSYLCDVYAPGYAFVPMRVDVAAAPRRHVVVHQTFRGNEWGNVGEKLGEASAVVPDAAPDTAARPAVLEVPVGVLAKKEFYEQRSGFNPMGLLKNPMILIGVAALGMMVVMPKMIESMDPEMREEFEKQQANSPFGALAGGLTGQAQPPGAGFDMAAWMAGTDKKDQGKSSGTESAPVKKRR